MTGQRDKMDFRSKDSAMQPKKAEDTSKPVALYTERVVKAKKQQSILRKIRYLLPKVLLDKSSVCKHDHGCFENIIRKAFANFLIGFGIQMIIKNLLLIAKPAKLLKNL